MKTRPTDLLACVALAGAAALSACSKPPPPPPPPPPKKVEAPPPPEPVRVDPLLQAMKADARVQFPQASAPNDESLARAIIGLCDSLARGDADKLKPMLDAAGKQVLDKLVSSGQWDESTGKAVEAVRVARLIQTGESGAVVTIAMQDTRGAYPLQWSVNKAAGTVIMTALPVANLSRTRASEFDGLDVTTDIAPAGGGDDAGAAADSGGGGAAGDAPKKNDDSKAPDPDAPKIRRTPNGPVTIPNPGKPGGG